MEIKKSRISKYVVLLTVLLVSLFGFAFYKYNEWKLLNQYTELYNNNWHEEFSLTEDANKQVNELLELNIASEATTSAKPIKQPSQEELYELNLKIISKLKLQVNSSENYLDTLLKNKAKFNENHIRINLPISNRIIFLKDLIK